MGASCGKATFRAKDSALPGSGCRLATSYELLGGGVFRSGAKQTHETGFLGMVQTSGFEPPTFGATIRRSNQLSYVCKGLEVARTILARDAICKGVF